MEDTVFKLACYTSENKNTGRIIEVALWNSMIEPGVHVITIATDEGCLELSIQDIRGLFSSIQTLLYIVDH